MPGGGCIFLGGMGMPSGDGKPGPGPGPCGGKLGG